MKRALYKWILLLLGFSTLFTSYSVHSSWRYAQEKVAHVTSIPSKILNTFEYAPEQVLPDDEIGKNHVVLIENLVSDRNGLNDPDSYLNEQIKKRQNGSLFKPKRDTLGSMGVDQGSELEKLFSLESENLSFLILFVSDTIYYIFTTEVELGENGKPTYTIGSPIDPIYRTIVEKINDTWVTQTSAKGYALSAYYEESNLLGNVTKIPSFDPDTWAAGTPPTP